MINYHSGSSSTKKVWVTKVLKLQTYKLPLIVDGSREFDSSLSNSRKFLPFRSNAWKDILYCTVMELQSCFLQKSQDNLQRKLGEMLNFLVFLFTKEYSSQFCLLGQSQNLMQLLLSFLKKSLSSREITAEWIWYRCNNKSKILLAACRESVMMTIQLMLGIPMA